MITWQDFEKVEMQIGTILGASDFPEARNSAYQLKIDFGSQGIKKSSAQIIKHYGKKDLIGRQVIAVVNFPPNQVANFVSECLVLGVVMEDNDIVLIQPERNVKNDYKIA